MSLLYIPNCVYLFEVMMTFVFESLIRLTAFESCCGGAKQLMLTDGFISALKFSGALCNTFLHRSQSATDMTVAVIRPRRFAVGPCRG